MKPYNPGGHAAYQEQVLAQLRKYYPDAASSLPASTWDIMGKFWALDLSELDTLMADRYSVFGPASRLPSDILRSILLSVEFKLSSYTKWAADLKENHLHAILSGFLVGDTPGVGTFYDFFSRLWFSDKNNLSDPVHPPKEKPQKPDKKGIRNCQCDRCYSQPDCNIGWDSHLPGRPRHAQGWDGIRKRKNKIQMP